jgi:hypothetical protein
MNKYAALTITFSMTLALAACSDVPSQNLPDTKIVQQFASKDLSTHAVRSIKQVVINRVAIMPVVAAVPFGGDPLASGAADSITADVYRQASGTWKLVSQNEVMQLVEQAPPGSNLDDTAVKIGESTSADGVLYGSVERYVERVGAQYAADKPASVAFALKLVDMKSKQVVWSSRFSKTQQPLGNNFFNLPNFLENKGQWITASELANEGVAQAINDLRSSLGMTPTQQTAAQ